MLRVLDDFFWVLRREGLTLSVVQVTDAARATREIGWSDRATLREALACITTQSPAQRRVFDRVFDRFFATTPPLPASRWPLPESDEEALAALLDLLRAGGDFAAAQALERQLPSQIDPIDPIDRIDPIDDHRNKRRSENTWWLLHGARVLAERPWAGFQQAGATTQRILKNMEPPTLMASLVAQRAALVERIGEERTAQLFQKIQQQRSALRQDVRAYVTAAVERRDQAATFGQPWGVPSAQALPLVRLNAAEADAVRRAVASLGTLLAGALLRRRTHARRHGPVDAPATLRAALGTGGVPISLVRRSSRRDRPLLWILCDVSDSARPAASFLLELVAALRRTQARLRTFVFVSDVAEITAELTRRGPGGALAHIYGGSMISLTHHSNYARALQTFERRWARHLTGRSTLLLFGDGRTNYRPAGVEILKRLRHRTSALYWLCPEPLASWGTGDSVMPTYAQHVTAALPASTGHELATAMRQVARRLR